MKGYKRAALGNHFITFVVESGNSARGELSVTKRIPNEKSQSQLATVPLYLLHLFALVAMFKRL